MRYLGFKSSAPIITIAISTTKKKKKKKKKKGKAFNQIVGLTKYYWDKELSNSINFVFVILLCHLEGNQYAI